MGCGLLSDWSTAGDDSEECTVCLTCVVRDNALGCFAKVMDEVTMVLCDIESLVVMKVALIFGFCKVGSQGIVPGLTFFASF